LTFSGNTMAAPLGQHFLSTPGPARALVRALDLQAGDTILEIGPGHGELTRFIAEAPHARIICIERDVRLAAALVHRYENDPTVTIVHGDVREVLTETAAPFGADWKLAGNIPYYLTSYLVRLMGDLPHPPTRAALLMQREVAERISAVPGQFTKLAAFAGAWAETAIVAHVPRSSFSPPPKVDSAILSFIRRESPIADRRRRDTRRTSSPPCSNPSGWHAPRVRRISRLMPSSVSPRAESGLRTISLCWRSRVPYNDGDYAGSRAP
jgi:16S rRNA (adenine1518-N6/adenine1519-N6)-dimethyltransferase